MFVGYANTTKETCGWGGGENRNNQWLVGGRAKVTQGILGTPLTFLLPLPLAANVATDDVGSSDTIPAPRTPATRLVGHHPVGT